MTRSSCTLCAIALFLLFTVPASAEDNLSAPPAPPAPFIPIFTLNKWDFKADPSDPFTSFPNIHKLEVMRETPKTERLTEDYLKALEAGNFEKILKTDAYETYFYYPELFDFKVIAAYALNDYASAARYSLYASDKTAFAAADSLANIKNIRQSLKRAAVLKNDEALYIKIKTDIASRRFDFQEALKRLSNEDLKFALLKFYIYREKAELNERTISYFHFADEQKQSYANFYAGYALYQQKNYALAAAYLSKTSSGEFALTAKLLRSFALYRIKKTDEAETDLISAINSANAPDSITDPARFALAGMYLEQGKHYEASILLESCEGNACNELTGEAYILAGKPKEAIEILLAEKSGRAQLLKAAAYYNLGNYSEAKTILSKLTGKNEEADRLRTLLCFREGKVREAENLIAKHKKYAPLAYDGAKELYAIKRYQDAYELIAQGKHPVEIMLLKGELLTKLKELQPAREVYKALIKDRLALYESFAALLALRTNDKSRISFINETLEYKEDFPQKDKLLVDMTEVALKIGDMTLAARLINLFFEKYDESIHKGEMYLFRATMFYASGRFRECLGDIARAEEASWTEGAKELRKLCTSSTAPRKEAAQQGK